MDIIKMKRNVLLLSVLAAMLCISAFILTAADTDADSKELEIGDTVTFGAGSGKVVHTDGQDKCAYNEDTQVTLTMTVLTKPGGYSGSWTDVGTVSVTGIEFKANSDLIYVPSYIVDKVGDSIGMYKVASISDTVIAEIDGKTIGIVLPKALRSTAFGKSVTVVTEGSYTDTRGNVVHYTVDETGCAYMNGYGAYTAYANAKTDADIRFCEQGTVTKVDYAQGQSSYDTKMVHWCTNDLTSNDTWVCGPSFADMIGTVLTYELQFTGKNVSYSAESIRCATNAVITIHGNTLKVNAFEVTAEPKTGSAELSGWNIPDGTKVTSDMKITADKDAPAESDDNVLLYSMVLAAIAVIIVAAILVRRAR